MPRVRFIDNDEGDWEIITVDGQGVCAGHKIQPYEWLMLMESLSGQEISVEKITLTQEEMENMEMGNY